MERRFRAGAAAAAAGWPGHAQPGQHGLVLRRLARLGGHHRRAACQRAVAPKWTDGDDLASTAGLDQDKVFTVVYTRARSMADQNIQSL